MRAVRRGTGARSAPLAAAKRRRQPELHWTRAEKPRGQLDGAVHPVPRRGAQGGGGGELHVMCCAERDHHRVFFIFLVLRFLFFLFIFPPLLESGSSILSN